MQQEKESQKLNLTGYNTYKTAQKLWQVHYQILLIIFPKEFIKFNNKNVKISKKLAKM